MDISNNYVPYFFLVGLVFIAFFFMLSIFGNFFLFIIKKYVNKEETERSASFLEQLFISFGIGVSIYISLCYFLDLFALFNLFTAYLSIIIFDISYCFYYYNERKEDLKKVVNKKNFQAYFKNIFSNKNNIFCIGALIFTITFIFIIQWTIITEATSLNYTDPYKWYTDTIFLLDNGHIDYYHLDYNYPSGHTFFNAGVLLIYPDYLFAYYYFKFIPLYFIIFYVIIALTVVRKLFKRNYLILLSLLFILTSRYFLSRTLLYLSSSLASGLLIISLLIIINRYPDYILGFLLAGLYFIHNLTTFYFIFVLVSFFLYRFIFNIRNSEIFYKQIKSISILILITFILLIPYLVSIYYIYDNTFIDFLGHFFERFEESDYAYIFKNLGSFFQWQMKLIYPLDYFSPFIEINFLELIDELFVRSIFLFFIFPFIGLFIYLKPKEKKKDMEILIFFKLFIIIILIFFLLPYIADDFNLFVKFRKRILQSFSLPVIIMALYAIEWIVNLSKKLTAFLVLKLKFYRILIQKNKFYSKFFRIDSIIIMFLITSLSSTLVMHRFPDYHYYYEDDLVEVVLYLRTHAESDSKILRKEYDTTPIFRMLYDMKVKEWDLNRSSTYIDLLLEIRERDIDYLIFPKSFFDNSSIDDWIVEENGFKRLVKNDEYYLFKIKN